MIANATTYLSRLFPDMRSRRVRRLIAEPHALYGVLLEAFRETDLAHHASGRGLLFRIEEATQTIPANVLVQSTEPPDWSRLEPEDAERFFDRRRQYEIAERSLTRETGERLRFRLRANPTASRKPGEEISPGKRSRGQVYPILEEEQQNAWLARKLEGAAKIVELRNVRTPHPRANPQGDARRKNTAEKIPLLSVLFEGVLEVENGEALAALQRAGIGRGKSFGFGLLSLPSRRVE